MYIKRTAKLAVLLILKQHLSCCQIENTLGETSERASKVGLAK